MKLLVGIIIALACSLALDAQVRNTPPDTNIYDSCEVMPEYPGGSVEMNKFIQQNIKYPRLALEQGHQGTVYISYIVEKDGSLGDFQIVKGVDGAPELDAEALRVVSKFPSHKAGTKNGDTVRVKVTMPVKFALQY